jgi:hypothetical protein
MGLHRPCFVDRSSSGKLSRPSATAWCSRKEEQERWSSSAQAGLRGANEEPLSLRFFLPQLPTTSPVSDARYAQLPIWDEMSRPVSLSFRMLYFRLPSLQHLLILCCSAIEREHPLSFHVCFLTSLCILSVIPPAVISNSSMIVASSSF